jgi:hypothetical protein
LVVLSARSFWRSTGRCWPVTLAPAVASMPRYRRCIGATPETLLHQRLERAVLLWPGQTSAMISDLWRVDVAVRTC